MRADEASEMNPQRPRTRGRWGVGLVALALVLVGCGARSDESPRRSAGAGDAAARVIVGIHGLRPKPEHPELAATWQQSLAHSLEVNGLSGRPLPFRMAYWALDRRENRGCAPRRRSQLWNLRSELLEQVKELRHVDLDMPALVARLDAGDLDALFELTHWHEAQEDLRRYYRGDDGAHIRSALVETLRAEQGKEILLIAHSMGSLVAYDVLREHAFDIRHLVTIGSPLGLQPIRARNGAGSDDVFRSSLGAWTNLADPLDPIAFDPDLDDDYRHAIDDRLVNAWLPPAESLTDALETLIGAASSEAAGTVVERLLAHAKRQADLWGYHGYCGYLQTPQMASILDDFLGG